MAENNMLLATPTRFLFESGDWSLMNEINPFEYQFEKPKETIPSPLSSTSSSPTSSIESLIDYAIPTATSGSNESLTDYVIPTTGSNESLNEYVTPTVTNGLNEPQKEYVIPPKTSGRKRRIVFEGEDAEERRKKFLERNRIAAYKCRQRKKCWIQELEKNAEIQKTQNEQLRTLVAQLKEESIYLRNLLLSHGNCDCEPIQAYIRKTSEEISNGSSSSSSPSSSSGITPLLAMESTTNYFPTQ